MTILTMILGVVLSGMPLKNCTPDALPFKAGEKITYTVHYKWGVIDADVAKAYFTCEETTYAGKKCFHGRLFGRNGKAYDPFIKIREDYQTWLSADALKPLKSTRQSTEASYECNNTYLYDWKAGNINASLNSTSKGQRNMKLSLKEGQLDTPSLFYIFRNVDFSKVKVGDSFPVTIASGSKVYTIHVRREADEVKNIRGTGKVRTVKLVVRSGISNEDGDDTIRLWLSDDANRVPVYFEAPLRVGRVTGRIYSYEGLKHPFSSLQK